MWQGEFLRLGSSELSLPTQCLTLIRGAPSADLARTKSWNLPVINEILGVQRQPREVDSALSLPVRHRIFSDATRR